MVKQLGLPYQEAVDNMDLHPCNDMRGHTKWADLAQWLQQGDRRRADPPKETFSHHAF